MKRYALFLIFLSVTACDGRPMTTYMEDQAAICKSRGGEPMQTYAGYTNGLVMGCHFSDSGH